MKKIKLKSLISETIMSNLFNVVIYGSKEQREAVNKEFVRLGGGRLFASFNPIDLGTSSFTIRNTQALQLIEKVLKQLGWERKGQMGHKDIVWTAPGWLGVRDAPKGTIKEADPATSGGLAARRDSVKIQMTFGELLQKLYSIGVKLNTKQQLNLFRQATM